MSGAPRRERQDLPVRTALVTGGSGQVGSRLVAGAHVTATPPYVGAWVQR